jgi:dUTP pyrophosphatase
MDLKVFRVRKGVKLPVRAHKSDAGMDLFYCPDHDTNINIPPGTSAVLPTGLKIAVPPNHMLEIKNKSGIAAKNQLLVGACVVDSGYDGEIFVNLHNTSAEFKMVAFGQKIAQAVLIPIIVPTLTEIDEDSVYGSRTERGSGKLGSTGEF